MSKCSCPLNAGDSAFTIKFGQRKVLDMVADVIGSIYSGVTTTTESAAPCVVGGLLIYPFPGIVTWLPQQMAG